VPDWEFGNSIGLKLVKYLKIGTNDIFIAVLNGDVSSGYSCMLPKGNANAPFL
jgi:hypothetical protein